MPGMIGVAHGEWRIPTPIVAAATRLYVCGNSGAIYKSTDGGATWTTLTGHGLTAPGGGVFGKYRIAVLGVVGGADVVYLVSAADTDIAVSTDGGATWTQKAGAGGFAVILEVDANGDVYWNGLYRSSNQGTSWAAIPSSGFMENATATKLWSGYDASNVSRMAYTGASQEIIPLAGTWISGPACKGQSDTMALAFGNGNDSSHLLEKVVGTTATVITPPTTGDVTDDPFVWAASNDGGTTILALVIEQDVASPNIGQLWRSVDGGSSWTKVIESQDLMPMSTASSSWHINYDPNDTDLWYVLGGRALTEDADAVLWQSTDNGVTWNSGVIASGETLLNTFRAVSG